MSGDRRWLWNSPDVLISDATTTELGADVNGSGTSSVATLTVAGKRVMFSTTAEPREHRLDACRIGRVRPGPCPGHRGTPEADDAPRVRRVAPSRQSGYRRGKDLLADRQLDMSKVSGLPKNNPVDGSDEQLAALARMQGFDGQPQVLDSEAMDRLVTDGWQEVWRGTGDVYSADLSGEQLAEQFRAGPVFYGQGIGGNGIYTSTDQAEVVSGYAGGNPDAVNRIALNPAARIADLTEIRAEMAERMPADSRQRIEALGAFQGELFTPGARTRENVARAVGEARETLQPQDWLWMDPSAYALARGFDAVRQQFNRKNYFVLLNRTAAAVQQGRRAPRTIQEIEDEEFSSARHGRGIPSVSVGLRV